MKSLLAGLDKKEGSEEATEAAEALAGLTVKGDAEKTSE